MKTFRELYLHMNGESIQDLVKKLTNHCAPMWQRNIEKEDDQGLLEETSYCFELKRGAELTSAALFLYPKSDDVWYVSNIVPTEISKLSYEQYNEVLENFYHQVLQPAIEGTLIGAEMTSDEITVASVAGKKVEEALTRFSTLANKSTGSSHPSDRKRWFQFLVQANGSDSELNSDIVIRALIEQGWPEEQAYKLGAEFETADELLTFYREL